MLMKLKKILTFCWCQARVKTTYTSICVVWNRIVVVAELYQSRLIRSYNYIIRTMATEYIQKKNHSERERWICIYPAYLDKTKTRAEGRRVPLTHAVEHPNYQEISEVLGNEGFKLAVENKAYPREKSHELQLRGRIRVEFRNDDGSLIKSNFPTRESIMMYCGEKIPFLKSRTQKDVKAPTDHGGQGGKKKGKKK